MAEHPIWRILDHQGRKLLWLARKTGYSESHVRAIRSGAFPASEGFRKRCAEALDLPADVLFHPRGAEPIGVEVVA